MSHLCKGCWRTLDEIAAWSTSTDAMKQKVWLLIAERKSTQVIDKDKDKTKTNPKEETKTEAQQNHEAHNFLF
ncbi:MAG: DUF1289 domain-containing protein [Rhodoferax sp.]|nr:DUF1289 domain-containing protein [Rhodoferax sp.]